MTPLDARLAALAPLLPGSLVGTVTAIEPISLGLSGAGVYAVSTSLAGELIVRVSAAGSDPGHWAQQRRVLTRAAEAGIAPAIVHVDEAARALVSRRVAGVPLAAALADPGQRSAVIAGVVAQLRALQRLDARDVDERDPLVYTRAQYATQRGRAGFPIWAAALEPLLAGIEARLAGDPRRVVGHNDLNPGNVLWDGARAWLVDWEVAGLAHPFFDLAALATFLQLDDAVAYGLLAALDPTAVDDDARATFAALRRLVAILCGLTLLGLVPELARLPASPPTLAEVYAGLRTGHLDLQDPRGRAAFALALLHLGAVG